MFLENISNEKIRKENLDKNQYTVSLLKEGFRAGIIDKAAVERIQTEIIFILRDLIMRYTKGESSSVTNETAEKILNSIYYSIDAYTLSFKNPEDSIAVLKVKSIKEIYEKGVETVTSCVNDGKVLYKEISENRLKLPLQAYNLTIDSIADFFEKYGIVFDAHNTMADIDYPLVFDNMSIRGIFYIKQYLETLKVETEFCRYFNVEEIEKTLKNYGRVCGIDYITSLINIFEVVINNSIFSVMVGNKAECLVISQYQGEFLNRKFTSLTTDEIDFILEMAVERIIDDLKIENAVLIDYIHRYKTIFVPRVINAVENGSLHNIVITDEKDLQERSLIFEEGNRMAAYICKLYSRARRRKDRNY